MSLCTGFLGSNKKMYFTGHKGDALLAYSPYFHHNNARGMYDFTDSAPIMRVIVVGAL